MRRLLEESLYCNISTVCEDGSPWNTPVFFVYHDKAVYWWSPLAAVHSQNILRNGAVFITVYDSTTTVGKGGCIYLKGDAKVLEDGAAEEIEKIIAQYNAKAGVPDFYLSKQLVSGDAPTRLFKAAITKAWRNTAVKQDGYYVDIRKELEL